MPHVRRHEEPPARGESIRVRGLVQGVGFRPTVWRLARECGLAGDVANDAEGVLIHIWGGEEARARFARRLCSEAPPLSRIDALERVMLEESAAGREFRILASRAGAVHTAVVPDAATCRACLAEVLDAADRRHRYAFTNCTHCGPRLTIIERVPYDRANTSMAAFGMCGPCRREYEDPADRRFHAQPTACPECGPRLWLERAHDAPVALAGDPIEATVRMISLGQIVAIKGLGGFHLACDAGNEAAVAQLRRRKLRYEKPFALMARDLGMVRRYCRVSELEERLLGGAPAPIVLLDRHGADQLASAVAPGQRRYGFMLPYSPLHHLLMAGCDAPLVLTSGNRSEEPQCIGNDEARGRLAGIADALLMHDRDIVNRLDDSVLRVIDGAPALLRRARGYAPAPLALPQGFAAAPETLACGGELKATFCLLKDGAATLSQHLGDLEHPAACSAYERTLELYLRMFEHSPRIVAIDAHPEYLPAKAGRERALATGARLELVQHHHAHVAACLADNAIGLDEPPVLGVALDGLGYGEDGTLWGGEVLLADYRSSRRVGTLARTPMPGGAHAIREPWRMGFAHLTQAGEWQELARAYRSLPFFRALEARPIATLRGMIASGFNAPMTSSCGRLFDAVAAVSGLRLTTSYEGQAAIELEAAVDAAALAHEGYPFEVRDIDGLSELSPAPMWPTLLAELRTGVAIGRVAARFHVGLAQGLARLVERLASRHGEGCGRRVALSGGVFQNAILSALLRRRLEAAGFTVLRHQRVPANDGGLSLGQAVVAAARAMSANEGERTSCA